MRAFGKRTAALGSLGAVTLTFTLTLALALVEAGCHGGSGGGNESGGAAVGTGPHSSVATTPAAGATNAPAAQTTPAPDRPTASGAPSSPAATPYRVHPVTNGRAVEVRLSYAGKPRPAWKIPPEFASHCGGATEVPDTSVQVDVAGAVSGAVVWLDDVREGEPPPAASERMDQKGCGYAPHVLAMTAGAALELVNSDPANHATRIDLLAGPDDSVVKMLPPGAHETIGTKPSWAGAVARITCPIHPWMLGWALFFDHPYFAVVQGGVARLEKVPPGAWHLSVWHEPLSETMGDALDAKEPVRARFEVTVADRDVVKKLELHDDGTIR